MRSRIMWARTRLAYRVAPWLRPEPWHPISTVTTTTSSTSTPPGNDGYGFTTTFGRRLG